MTEYFKFFSLLLSGQNASDRAGASADPWELLQKCVIFFNNNYLFIFLDFEESRAAFCTLQNEDSCLLSFSLVYSDHGSIIYNPKLYGENKTFHFF